MAVAQARLGSPDAAPGRVCSDGVVLAVLLTGTFMAALDVAIVNVAAPQVRSDLGISDGVLQLVVSGYTVAYAALLITGARLGDDRGHRTLFLAGLAAFTGASLLAGVAWSGEVLVAARVAQGVAAAMLSPQVVTVIQLRFASDARARALALYATTIAVAVVVGQIAGGALVSLDLAGTSWRPVFLVNVPIGVALLVVGHRVLPATRSPSPRALDLRGAALLAASVLLLVVPLVFGREAGWPGWAFAALAGFVPATALLVWHLRRLRARGGDPLVDLTVLGRSTVALGLLGVTAQMVAYGGLLFSVTVHLQTRLEYAPWESGLVFAPYAVAFAATSLAVPRLAASKRNPVTVLGLAGMSAGYFGIVLASSGGGWNAPLGVALLAVAGAGFGCGYSPTIARLVAGVPAEKARDASGLFTTVNQLSFAVGVATIGSMFLARAADTNTGSAIAAVGLACGLLGVGATALAVALERAEHAVARPRPTE